MLESIVQQPRFFLSESGYGALCRYAWLVASGSDIWGCFGVAETESSPPVYTLMGTQQRPLVQRVFTREGQPLLRPSLNYSAIAKRPE